ncbi:MAG: T9SS type A sorting domain-containing protein [candidate division WOR-3 bacterium]|nr:MAG: T9SS type A sorting domain-containing protein [candidate division WOR-3 bacterium]
MLNEANVKHVLRTTVVAFVCVLVIPSVLFAQWEPDYRLTANNDSSFTSYNNAWCVAANEDTVHVVWYDNRDGNYEIYYKRSSDGGVTWGPDTRLTDEPSGSYNPSIAIAGPEIHVVWEDERSQDVEVYHKYSTDGGITWGSDVHVSVISGPQGMPSVAVVASCVHVVWVDFTLMGNSEIYYCRSVDGGTTWDAPVQISYAAGFSTSPSIAAHGSNVHIAWHDSRFGWWNNEIFYRRSTNDGVDWSPEQQLTMDTTFSNTPSIAASGNNIHVVWEEMRDGNFEIYYKNSTDNGQIWSTDLRLTSDAADSHYPSAAASGSNIHVTWQDTRDGNDEIYYKVSNDYGVSWDPDIRLTDDQSISQNASVAVAGQKVHVLWTDERDGNWELYYKRNPSGNPGIVEFSDDIASAIHLVATPNPFSKLTAINFGVAQSAKHIALDIYDAAGRLVKNLLPTTTYYLLPATVSWDGTDQTDRSLPTGVYFLKLTTEDYSVTKKVLLVR